MGIFNLEQIKGRLLVAMVGALLLCIMLPTLPAAFFRTFDGRDYLISNIHAAEEVWAPISSEEQLIFFFENCLMLVLANAIMCGPGALILAYILMKKLSEKAKSPQAEMTEVTKRGAFLGATCGMLNLPGWLAYPMLHDGTTSHVLPAVQTITLFLVTGSACGLWVAWQAWRQQHPDAGAFPRFGLRTLIALIISCGVMFMLFVPHGT